MAKTKYIVRIVKLQRSKRHPGWRITCYVGTCQTCGKEVVIVASQWKRWRGWCHHCAVRRPHNPESKRSGLYAIRNKINGRCYYGSTIDWYRRKYTHRRELRLGKHHCQYLQRAWKKYGEDAFEFLWLIDVPCEQLFFAEQELLTNHKDKYNTGMAAGSAFLGRRHSEESKRKMRLKRSQQTITEATKEKLRKANLGKRRSEESIAKFRQSIMGRGRGYCWNKVRQRWAVNFATDNGRRRALCKTEYEAIAIVMRERPKANSINGKEVAYGRTI